MSKFEELAGRYASGEVPWDSEMPPPEVMELAADLEPGRALDLGSGYGRASIFLAQLGWQVDAVDFVPQAIEEATKRTEAAGVVSRVNYHIGSVANLSFLKNIYDLALDVGCLHNLAGLELASYRDELTRLLRPGAMYLLFVRLSETEEAEVDGPRSMQDPTIRGLFEGPFELLKVEYGETQVEERSPWRSAWYWFRRTNS